MNFSDKTTKLAASILPFIGAAAFISLIFGNNLWMDEAFSAVLVKGSFSEMMEKSLADTLPPLYNILNWSFTKLLGFSAPALRLSSLIPMLGCLALGGTLVRSRFGDKCSLIYVLCMTGMPALLYYLTEIRMYALGLFFVTATGILALELAHKKTGDLTLCCFLVASAAGAGYTHHFAFVAAGFVYLFLLVYSIFQIKEHPGLLRRVIICIAGTLILYIPCFFSTLKQTARVQGYFTMPEADAGVILGCLKQPFITNCTPLSALLLLAFAAVTVYGVYALVIKKNREFIPPLACIILYPCVMLFGFLANIILKANIFSQRYLVPSLGLFWLGFAIICSKICLSKKLPRIALILLLGAVVIFDYGDRFVSEYAPGADEMTSFFSENVSPGDSYIIYEDDYQIRICFRYYFPDLVCTSWDEVPEGGRLWYIEVPGFETKKEEITAHGYTAEKAGDFSFDRYSFTLYSLTR